MFNHFNLKVISLAMLFVLISGGTTSANRGQALKVIVKVGTGAAAAFSASKTVKAKEAYNKKSEIIAGMERQGIDTTNGALYHIMFQVDPNASDRWFFRPNVFALVQIEGQHGDFIPASRAKAYQGQPFMVSFYAKEIKPGSKVIVHLLDDKSLSDQIWDKLLKTKSTFQAEGMYVFGVLKVRAAAETEIQLVDENFKIEYPGYLATAVFEAPSAPDGSWNADGTLFDRNGREAGYLDFIQSWKVGQSDAEGASMSGIVFWCGLAIVFGLIFFKYYKAKDYTEKPAENKT